MKNNKILSQKEVFELSYNLRKKGKVVGLTHGAFDLFHVSHLDLLRKSKDLCDFLIVGVESDERIREYKHKYPTINIESRMEILSELECVNLVFKINDKYTFSSDYQKIYQGIRPDIIMIGKNFSAEKQIEKDIAKTSKSQLIRIMSKQKYTTTNIVNLIINNYKATQNEI